MSDKGAIWLDQKSAELEARTAEPIGTARRPGESLDPIPAARLVAQRWKRIVRWQGAFWIWQDGAYQSLTDEAVRSGAYDTLEGLNERPNANRVSNVLDAMRATLLVDEHMEPPCWLSTNKPLERGQVAMRNGILDLASGKLAPPSPDLFTLSALPVSYEPDATAPHWQQFLERLWPDDAEAIQAVQELFGYLISGETHQQKVFLLVGPKRGGKGTILRVLTAMLGRHNVAAPTLGSLSQPFGLQALIGKLAAIVSDARLSGRADQEAIAERLLSVSGEDHVSIPRKFLPDYTAQLQARFVLATNELPRLHDASGALASRFVPLVLSRSWYGREDHGLTDRLLREIPGIFRWSLDGYRRLAERGHFQLPASAADAVQELHDLGSPVGAFLRESCTVEPGAEIAVSTLYQAWRLWCEAHGRNHPGNEQTFGRDLRAAVPGVSVTQVRRDGKRVRVYQGIRQETSGDCHAVSRVHNHCTRSEETERESRDNNALSRVTPRDTQDEGIEL